MKRLFRGICIIATMSLLCGCTKNTTKKEEVLPEVDPSSALVMDGDEITNMSTNLPDTTNYSLDYVLETDDQPFYDYKACAESAEGLYFWEDSQSFRLRFYDFASEKSVVLCNKPNCSHLTLECDALFKDVYTPEVEFTEDYIQYYDGKIYLRARTSEGYVNLYSVNKDGSELTLVMSLFRVDVTKGQEDGTAFYREPEMLIHRGYVYYINNMDEEIKICRTKLGSDSSEVIFQNDGIRPNTYRLKAVGDYLFFQSGNFVDENYIDITGGIFAYNINTGDTIRVNDVISTYEISNDILYYTCPGKIECLNLKTGETKLIKDFGDDAYHFIGVVDSTICVESDDELVGYDVDGNELFSIDGEKTIAWRFGHHGKLFIYGTESVSDGAFSVNKYFFDLNTLETKPLL